MSVRVPASEFTRNFDRYRLQARRAAVAISSQGRTVGYFVGADAYEEFRRFKDSRRHSAMADLSEARLGVGASPADAWLLPLDALLDPK